MSLHMCHLDIISRNILLGDDGLLCILDWGNAGFYLALFELWAIHRNLYSDDTTFLEQLLGLRSVLNPGDRRVLDILDKYMQSTSSMTCKFLTVFLNYN